MPLSLCPPATHCKKILLFPSFSFSFLFPKLNSLISSPTSSPTGTRIGFPGHAIEMSPLTTTFSPSSTSGGSVYVPPSTFDGLRFYKLRAQPGNETKHQYVTTSPDSLAFGHGLHACPGRFFASHAIKVVLIELLRSWDLRLKGCTDTRPEVLEYRVTFVANKETEIQLQRRGC